jgi:hypothetical protein
MHDNADSYLIATKQINELIQIKNSVQELETVYQKARQGYEDEITKLRAEIQNLRAAAAAAPPSTHSLNYMFLSFLMILSPGASQLGLSLPAANSQGPMPVIERGYGAGDVYDRDRGERDLPKRLRSRDGRGEPVALVR